MTEENEILCGSVLDESWLTVEQLAMLCEVEPQWLLGHLDAGLFRHVESEAVADPAGRVWRFQAQAVQRARRMRCIERDFDAAPELAALVADLLEEIDALRRRLRRAGLED